MKRRNQISKIYFLLIICYIFISCNKSNNSDYHEFVDSLRNTKVRVYYKEIKGEKIYHGKYISTNNNGKIIKDYNFFNGKLSGKQIRRFDNGNLKAIVFYKNGLKNGYEIVFNERGKKIIERKYKNDKIILEEYYYHENGKIKSLIFNDYNGDIVFYIEFDKNGYIVKREGILIHCFERKNKLNTTCFEIIISNIQNTNRKIKFVYDDNRKGIRNLKKINDNFILVEEMVTKRGKNRLNVKVEYKFDKKYHNQVLRDSTYVEYFVE